MVVVTLLTLGVFGLVSLAHAANVPEQINYQAKIEANGVPFDGVGKLKVAIVDQGETH